MIKYRKQKSFLLNLPVVIFLIDIFFLSIIFGTYIAIKFSPFADISNHQKFNQHDSPVEPNSTTQQEELPAHQPFETFENSFSISLVSPEHALFDSGIIITNVNKKKNQIALTFDSSWEFKNTREILNILKGYSIKSTFFVTGSWAEKHPDLVQDILNDGHEIGNHSYSHPHFTQISKEQIIDEVQKTAGIIKRQTGYHSNLFRLPYGDTNQEVLTLLSDMGYYVIGWSADSLDWKEDISAEEIINRIKKYHKDGGIILFHIGGFQTPVVLPDIIEWYLNQGYEFVKVSELIQEQ